MYKYEYNKYVQESENLGNDILGYENWKESQGYRNEYDDDY